MKKRLRKKLHKGEFQEFGFDILIQFKQTISFDKKEIFIDDFIELIEELNLLFGGGGSELTLEGFITAEKGSVTNLHENKISSWLESKSDLVESFKIEKKDAWN
jgi:uncharacterized protein